MKRSIVAVIFCIIMFNQLSFAAGIVTNEQMGYALFLEDNWIIEAVSDSQHIIYDTTAATAGYIGIVRHHYDNSAMSAQEWSRTYFLANLMVARYSADPHGVVLYIDSSLQSTQGALWAPESYIEYYSLDSTLGSYREFIRYPASTSYGYELYAISDTADMSENVGLYAAMLSSIQLPQEEATALRQLPQTRTNATLTAPHSQPLFTPMGRALPAAMLHNRTLPPGLYLNGSSKLLAGMR
jgi:hypothetical protein